MRKFAFLFALALAVAPVAPALAEQPACTGDRHYDETGQCCPSSVTTTTLPCTGDDCEPDEGCPDPAPCPPVTVTCQFDACVSGACTNGSLGTDGAGLCVKDSDCAVVGDTTVTITNTVNNITVNRCPQQETLVPCRRQNSGRVICPTPFLPRREFVPYSTAVRLPSPKRAGKRFHLPPHAPQAPTP
jgi:hypothetical protein